MFAKIRKFGNIFFEALVYSHLMTIFFFLMEKASRWSLTTYEHTGEKFESREVQFMGYALITSIIPDPHGDDEMIYVELYQRNELEDWELRYKTSTQWAFDFVELTLPLVIWFMESKWGPSYAAKSAWIPEDWWSAYCAYAGDSRESYGMQRFDVYVYHGNELVATIPTIVYSYGDVFEDISYGDGFDRDPTTGECIRPDMEDSLFEEYQALMRRKAVFKMVCPWHSEGSYNLFVPVE